MNYVEVSQAIVSIKNITKCAFGRHEWISLPKEARVVEIRVCKHCGYSFNYR